MKRLYVVLLLVSSGFIVGAQSPRSTPLAAAEALAAVPSQADTVRAVRNLFDQRRRGGRRYFILPSKFTVLPSVALLLVESNPIGVVAVGGVAGVGVGKMVRFAARKETALLEAYQQGRPLPNAVRKRLRPKHFR